MAPDLTALARAAADLLRAGRDAEALAAWQELARLEPGNPRHWINLGTLLRAQRRLDEALAAYIEAAARGEASPGFLYNVGLLHQDRGDYASARRVLADALARAPDDVEIRLQYAQCCYECLHIEAAVAALAGWREWPGAGSAQLATLALLLLNLGEAREAAAAAERACADPDPPPQALLRLAQVQERSNRVAESRATFRRLAALPGAASLGDDLRLLGAQLDLREGRHADAIAGLSALAGACAEPDRRHLYLFPLAKAQDASGRHAEAWESLREAHTAQLRQLARTNPEAAGLREAPLLITRHGCDPADVARWEDPGAPDREGSPVFIVAFPRSGTTLLEQMLDAHPALASMDEQPFLQQAIDRITDFGVTYPARLADLTPAQLDEARDYYWSLARRKASLGPGQRLVDKNPLNLLRLPAIRRLFPRSPVLLAIRHPCDVLLSCYLQHFRSPEFAVLCRDLGSLARGYHRAFDYWYGQQALLRAEVLELRYEALVADVPGHAARIMDFLGLGVVPFQLEPAAHARARGYISTPSYAQVVEPVHRRAIGRWQPYAPWFGDALGILGPWLARWGYAAGAGSEQQVR
jgi:tetratricopeptide (TPR) repeat protein